MSNINSLSIFNNLLEFIYVYPPSLIIIYSIIIVINKCHIEIPTFIKKFLSDSNNNNSNNNQNVKKTKKERKRMLWETDCTVLRSMGFIILVSYLLIRYFMSAIKNKLKLRNLECRTKIDLEKEIKNKEGVSDEIKTNTIAEKDMLCTNAGSKQTTKHGKCNYCITIYDNNKKMYPCELHDTSTNSTIIYDENSIDDKCKYYDDKNGEEDISDKEDKALYIFNNFNIFLLIMFFLGTFFYKKNVLKLWREICAYIIPSLLMLIVFIWLYIYLYFKESKFENFNYIFWFNLALLAIISFLHLINMKIYNKYIR